MDVVPTVIGCTDDSEDRSLVNFNSYRIISKTVRGQRISLLASQHLLKLVLAMESCLIPYRFSKHDTFQAWLGVRLAEFPLDREHDILDGFYHQR